jgi:hypothetical protein
MSDTPDRPSDLSRIFDEFLVRRRLGESPILDEYCQRFPDLAEQLRLHVRLYDALGEAGPASGDLTSTHGEDPSTVSHVAQMPSISNERQGGPHSLAPRP